MKANDDPFVPMEQARLAGSDDSLDALLQRRPLPREPQRPAVPAVARLVGFDLLEQPLVSGLPASPGAVHEARSTVALRSSMAGREVLVIFENGEIERPIIIGVIETRPLQDSPALPPSARRVTADDERHVIEAGREIVLRCGEASITLTRAGKVIIRGNYILSRSSGYNRIKGAAIDIN